MQKKFSLATIGLGLALLVYMVTVEDEPGALPLAMIVLGSLWHFVDRTRLRSRVTTTLLSAPPAERR